MSRYLLWAVLVMPAGPPSLAAQHTSPQESKNSEKKAAEKTPAQKKPEKNRSSKDAAGAKGKRSIEGRYDCQGTGYAGIVEIRRTQEAYLVVWNLGANRQVGVGLRKGDTFSVGIAVAGAVGLVVYEIDAKGNMEGLYTGYPGVGAARGEALNYKSPLAKWKVGDKVFVNWSRDSLWYPATVRNVKDDKYLVRYADGSFERVTNSRITADTLTVGDHVIVIDQVARQARPATVTKRSDDKVTVIYADKKMAEVPLQQISTPLPPAPADMQRPRGPQSGKKGGLKRTKPERTDLE